MKTLMMTSDKNIRVSNTDEPEFEIDAENDDLDDIPSEREVRKMFKELKDE